MGIWCPALRKRVGHLCTNLLVYKARSYLSRINSLTPFPTSSFPLNLTTDGPIEPHNRWSLVSLLWHHPQPKATRRERLIWCQRSSMPFPPHKSCRGTVWLLIPQTRERSLAPLGIANRKAKGAWEGPGGTESIKHQKNAYKKQGTYIGNEERYTQLHHHHHHLSIAWCNDNYWQKAMHIVCYQPISWTQMVNLPSPFPPPPRQNSLQKIL